MREREGEGEARLKHVNQKGVNLNIKVEIFSLKTNIRKPQTTVN
jgi:hypothetical protein